MPTEPARRVVRAAGVLLLALSASGQIDPATALLARGAWEALRTGRTADAVDGFTAALAADPRNARLHLGAAIAAALERRDADARAESERALELEPGLVEARALLGQVLYRLHDVAGAIRAYEALSRGASDSGLANDAAATLDRWRRERDLHGRMQQAVGSHFTIAFEGPEEAALADRALGALDRAYWRIGQLLAVYPSEPIAVVLYTSEQFRDITRSPSWAAGAYDGTIRVPMRGALDRGRELDRVLSHEFTHALIRTLAARGVPAWLDEGLATALESGGTAWAADLTSRARRMPLAALQSGFGRLIGEQAQLAYATSAVAARRLLDTAGGVAVANLLRDLGDGVDFDGAFLHRIQQPFPAFDSALY
jgi:tetratricopeptide (TPR) repeat protein